MNRQHHTVRSTASPARLRAIASAALAAAIGLVAPDELLAQNRFFNSASSGTTWNNGPTTNWGTVTGGPYNTTTFGGFSVGQFEGTGATINSAGVSVNGLYFTANGYTIQGGTITKGNPLTGPTFSVSSGVTAAINTSIASAAYGFQKIGTGTLELGGNVQFSTANTNADYWLEVDAGTLRLTGGTSSNPAFLVLGNNGAEANAQTFAMTGGTMTQAEAIFLGNSAGSGTSTLDFSGGTFTQTAGSVAFANRNTANINVSGTANVTLGAVTAGANAENSQVATLNLNGGTLTAPSFTKAGTNPTFILNFNGGTLRPTVSTASYISSTLTRANVRNGGAVVNTNGFNITIVEELLHSNIGGDNATDGGLTKLGAGALTVSGVNTYTGNTTVNEGVLSVAGSIANNGSNKVFVAADANGDFASGAATRIDRARAAAASYTGFGSAITSSLLTEADLLSGSNTTGLTKTLGMAWRTRASTVGEGNANESMLISDVLNLTGIGGTKFVLQMSYTDFAGDAAAAAAGQLLLGWLDEAANAWENAVIGNIGTNIGSFQGDVAWNATFFDLGDWGADSANNVVWAVLDHNSQFAVLVPTPAALPAGLAVLGLAGVRRRRR